MRVEHFEPQSKKPNRRLDWVNLLAACPGRAGKERHCDLSKDDTTILLDPQRPEHIAALSYGNTGTMRSSNARHQQDLDDVLNLNDEVLEQARKAALDTFLKQHKAKREQLQSQNWNPTTEDH